MWMAPNSSAGSQLIRSTVTAQKPHTSLYQSGNIAENFTAYERVDIILPKYHFTNIKHPGIKPTKIFHHFSAK